MTKTEKRTVGRRYFNLVQKARAAEIYIYGDIASWPWAESDVSSYNLAQRIAGLDVDAIDVYINSYGGEVAEGLAIYAALCRHPAAVITHCDGFACSAASVVFMAGDARYISPLGQLMIHEVWNTATGNASALRKAADDLAQINKSAANAYRGRVNVSDERLYEMLATETWLNAGQAVELGFATAEDSFDAAARPAMSAQESAARIFRAGLAALTADGKAEKPPLTHAETAAGAGEITKAPQKTPTTKKTTAGGQKLFSFRQANQNQNREE